MLKTAIAAAAILTGATACNTSGCIENLSAIPQAGFYAESTGKPVTLKGMNIFGVGAPEGAMLLEAATAASTVYLPLRSENTVTRFCIAYTAEGLDSPEMNDTLTLTYTSMPYFVSEECGASWRYRITRVQHTTHLLRRVEVTDSLITNVDTERLRLYFPVTTEE